VRVSCLELNILKTNDFTYLSDQVQIELYLKCSITHETKTKLDGKKMEKYKKHINGQTLQKNY